MQEALYDLVESIRFKKHTNPFQEKLKKDFEDLKNESKVIIKADKVPIEAHKNVVDKLELQKKVFETQKRLSKIISQQKTEKALSNLT